MSKFFNVLVLLFMSAVIAFAQVNGGFAPDANFQTIEKPNALAKVMSAEKTSKTLDGFIYSTTTYTFADLIVFSYFNKSQFYLIDAAGIAIDSVLLNENEYHVFSPGTGVFSIEGNQSFTLLIGDPITNSVMGYFAVDESGSPLSTRLNTYMPAYGYSGEHFIIFGYNDGTGFQIKDLSNNTTVAAGILNEGEHFMLDGYNAKFLGVYADKPVSALSYTDQGYYIPSSNGTFAGKQFYGFSGYVGGWGNGIIVTSYEDSTDFVAINSATGDTLFQGRLDKGMVSSYSVYADLFWEVRSTGRVTVCNTPYASYTGSYYYLTRQVDESGLGIGTNFYAPVIPGNVNLFSYEDNNEILIHNLAADDTTWIGVLNAGQGFSFSSSKAVYHIMSHENVAVISSWGGGYGADFMPLNFATGLPDLAVSSKDITFDPEKESYDAGDMVTIYANIHNYGYENAYNVRVKFYDGHPSGGVAISSLLNVGTIEAGGSTIASAT